MMKYCDAHVEFIHPSIDLRDLDPLFLSKQINPTLINKIRPELLFFAVSVNSDTNSWKKINWVIDEYLKMIEANQWVLVKSKNDLAKKGIKIILHLEDLGGIGKDLGKIDILHQKGIRSIGLTHNKINQFAGGVFGKRGLTKFGQKAIAKILSLGIILDFAHLNEKSFFDIVERHDIKPFISHAGIFAVYHNLRNINNNILKTIKEKDGFVGIGFAGSFLSQQDATINDVLAQINYAIKKAGKNHVGIGSDFGGIISYLPEKLETIGKIKNLVVDDDIRGNNLINFLNKVLKDS